MARPTSIDETDLIARVARVFSDVGYEGASLARLSQATGLQKASLYHRFPGGKRQMAEDVLAASWSWIEEHVLTPLTRPGDPKARLKEAARHLNAFYWGGRRACLLNMLSSPRIEDGPFAPAIKSAIEALIAAFAAIAVDAGCAPDEARRRSERTVMMLQGSLVLSRGLGSAEPFQAFLAALPADLFGDDRQGDDR